MVTEALLAERVGVSERGLAAEVARVLGRMRLPVMMDASLATEDIVRTVELDKKTLGGTLRLALPEGIGRCSVVEVAPDALAGAINAHREWNP